MKLRYILILFGGIILATVGTTFLLFHPSVSTKIVSYVEDNGAFGVPFINKLISKPDPVLTMEGVITDTNAERVKQQAKVLIENKQLDAAAAAKVQDMFTQHYFEHMNPQGKGPGDLAYAAGYTYLIVGENLAEGNFDDDADLVAAWMASPGHRANILNPSFTDIGVAVGKGMMDGKSVWLAVQEFGAPTSICPAIDASLKVSTDAEKKALDILASTLSQEQHTIAALPQDTEAERATYNQAVAKYNVDVASYSTQSSKLESNIDTYNTEVRNFNGCLNTASAESPETKE